MTERFANLPTVVPVAFRWLAGWAVGTFGAVAEPVLAQLYDWYSTGYDNVQGQVRASRRGAGGNRMRGGRDSMLWCIGRVGTAARDGAVVRGHESERVDPLSMFKACVRNVPPMTTRQSVRGKSGLLHYSLHALRPAGCTPLSHMLCYRLGSHSTCHLPRVIVPTRCHVSPGEPRGGQRPRGRRVAARGGRQAGAGLRGGHGEEQGGGGGQRVSFEGGARGGVGRRGGGVVGGWGRRCVTCRVKGEEGGEDQGGLYVGRSCALFALV